MIRVASVPNISDSNPYQRLFYEAVKKFDVKPVENFNFNLKGIFSARNNFDCVHFHWAPAPKNSCRSITDTLIFAVKLMVCKCLGKKILWTAHNLFPHDRKNIFIQYIKRFILVHSADLIIVHFQEAIKEIASIFFVSRKKIVCMHHGLYDQVYPNTISRDEARKKLNIPDKRTVFLFFGEVRPYKNLEVLISSFLQADIDNCSLIIAGRCKTPSYEQELSRLICGDPRVLCFFEYISNDQAQYFFNSADCTVLPYKNIFTSGAALLALTFRKPIIMSQCAFAEEYLRGEFSILVKECDIDNLSNALKKFEFNKETYVVLNDDIAAYQWDAIADNLFHNPKVLKVLRLERAQRN